jgi:hypothetical protein
VLVVMSLEWSRAISLRWMEKTEKRCSVHTIGYVGMIGYCVWMIMVYCSLTHFGFIHYEDNRNYISGWPGLWAMIHRHDPFAHSGRSQKPWDLPFKVGNVLINIGLVLMFVCFSPGWKIAAW